MYKHIVLNQPHASVEGLYDNQLSYWQINTDFINNVVIPWTDWHTDFLFNPLQDVRIKRVRFPYSRFIVDAERLWNDPLESVGQGIVYRQFGAHSRNVPKNIETRLKRLWQWHQKQLVKTLQPDALLLDCHSFPSHLSDVDICIGYNNDWSKPDDKTISKVADMFDGYGYRVGVNNPYSNSETPSCNFRYHSLMLEVNKKCYLRHRSIELHTLKHFKKPVQDAVLLVQKELLE